MFIKICKSDKLLKYLYRKQAKDKSVKVDRVLRKWSDKEVIDILSNLEYQDKIKVTGRYRMNENGDTKMAYQKVESIHLREDGVEYHHKYLRDDSIKRWALIFGLIISIFTILNMGHIAYKYLSTPEQIKPMVPQIELTKEMSQPKTPNDNQKLNEVHKETLDTSLKIPPNKTQFPTLKIEKTPK